MSELDMWQMYIELAKFYTVSYQYLRKFQPALIFKKIICCFVIAMVVVMVLYSKIVSL